MIRYTWTRAFVMASVALLTSVMAAGAQLPPQGGEMPGDGGPRRQMLEQRLRERTGELVQRRLQLTPDQMTRLQAANRQFEQQRTELVMKEREVRRELRQQLVSGSADQDRVAALLDQAILMERQRIDLTQSEQRELSKFLTPVQRAKLFGLQNEIRRRAQQMRMRQMGRPGQGGPGGPMRPIR